MSAKHAKPIYVAHLRLCYSNNALLRLISKINLRSEKEMATAQVLRPGPVGQPDIDYAPNLDKYVARTKRRTNTEKLDKGLPSGFPSRLESDLVWDGSDIAEKYDWVYELTTEDVEEIEKALVHFKCELFGHLNAYQRLTIDSQL